ncbi:MAG: hypothetical protein ACWA41_11330 [Putridiphycobacter sp.]
MFLRLTLLLGLATGCNHLLDKSDNINLIGDWEWVEASNLKKELNAEGWIEIFSQNDDSLKGTHTFIAQKGNRVDFCDSNFISLKLRYTNNGWNGLLVDCYEGNKLPVVLSAIDDSHFLFVFKNTHPFLTSDTLLFEKIE